MQLQVEQSCYVLQQTTTRHCPSLSIRRAVATSCESYEAPPYEDHVIESTSTPQQHRHTQLHCITTTHSNPFEKHKPNPRFPHLAIMPSLDAPFVFK